MLIIVNHQKLNKNNIMYKFKQQVPKKELKIIENILEEIPDYYRDFYITKDNTRLFLKENPELLFKSLRNGDRIVYDCTNRNGLAITYGISDKAYRIYLKILAKNKKIAEDLLKVIKWNITYDLFIKVKKVHPLAIKNIEIDKDKSISILEKHGFTIIGNRGKELLFKRG